MDRRPVKSKFLAVILAAIFGTFGAHRFYLGEISAGFFYLIMSIFFFPIPAFLSIFDAFRLLMMDPRRFDRRYNSGNEDVLSRKRNIKKTNKQINEVYQERKRQSGNNTRSRVNPYKRTGVKKYKEYDIEGAIEDFNKGLDIEPNDVSLHFNLARAYSLQEETSKALHHLNQAILNGFGDVEKIKTHDDLAFLRIQPEFEKFQANGYKMDGKVNIKEKNLLEDDMLLSQLNKLSELRKKGLLSEEEFSIEKKKLLKR